jgi:hypothetical protein
VVAALLCAPAGTSDLVVWIHREANGISNISRLTSTEASVVCHGGKGLSGLAFEGTLIPHRLSAHGVIRDGSRRGGARRAARFASTTVANWRAPVAWSVSIRGRLGG